MPRAAKEAKTASPLPEGTLEVALKFVGRGVVATDGDPVIGGRMTISCVTELLTRHFGHWSNSCTTS